MKFCRPTLNSTPQLCRLSVRPAPARGQPGLSRTESDIGCWIAGSVSAPGVVLYTPPAYGWGNRMLDLAACLLLCLLTDRLLIVNWTSPSPLTNLAIPQGFDWSATGQAPLLAVLFPS